MDIDISPIDSVNVDISEYIDFVIEKLRKHVSLVKNSEYKKIAFTPSNKNNFKKFFEEIVPLMFFLKTQEQKYHKVKYTAGNQKWDAILDDKITVEITKAQHKKKYLVTQDIINHGFAFSPKRIQEKPSGSSLTKTQPYVRTNKEHVDDVALYIFEAIDKKRKKNYPNNSILLILFESDTLLLECDGDYSYLEKKIANYDKGNFTNIYIVENFILENFQPKWQYLL